MSDVTSFCGSDAGSAARTLSGHGPGSLGRSVAVPGARSIGQR